MNRKRKREIMVCVAAWIVVIGLAIGCSLKEHELTPEEAEAAMVTEELRSHAETETETETETEAATEKEAEPETTTEEAGEPDTYADWHEEEAEPEPDQEEEPETDKIYSAPTDEEGRYQFTSDELWEMTRIVYLENGITYPECTYMTVYLTACVILNRLYDWDECADVYGVIFQQGQYSTAYRYEDYNGADLGTSNPEGWEISELAVYQAISDCDRAPHFQSMAVQGEVYYIDPNTGEVFCY